MKIQFQKNASYLTLAIVCVLLIISVAVGNVASQSQGPTAEFVTSPSDPDPDEAVSFDASGSTGEIVDYEWRYEVSDSYRDQTASGRSFSHTFTENGRYDVTLEVVDSNGTTDSISKTIVVKGDDPTAAFSFSPSEPLPDETVSFDASESTAPAGSIENYEWRFEVSDTYRDQTSYGSSFSHTYTENGEYDVTLEIEDNGGATDAITKTIKIGGEDPTAEFSVSPSEPLPDETVSFDASGSTAPAGNIESYEWRYEVTDSYRDQVVYGKSFSHAFKENGRYDVTLEVKDNGGAIDTTTKTIKISGQDPTAAFDVSPSEPLPDEAVSFDASRSTAPAGNIESYEWSYEVSDSYRDEVIYGQSFTHTFKDNGEYDITLEVEDNGGTTNSLTKTIKVGGEDPTAAFSMSDSEPLPGQKVSFDGSGSTAPAGSIESYDWSYEVSDSYRDQTAYGSSFSHTFTQPGEYDLTLEVEDNGGATNSITKTIKVGGDGPSAEFDISPPTPAPNEEITFDASDSSTPAGSIDSYQWAYETEYHYETVSGESLTHSFPTYGEYQVKLMIENTYGQTSSVTKTIEVTGDGPTADFKYSPSNPGLDERVIFKSTSTAPDLAIKEYRWYVNGESQYADEELTMTFDEPAIYNVELEVENKGGKVDRISKTVAAGEMDEIIDNPDFKLRRSSPEAPTIASTPGERISFNAQLDSPEVPKATMSLFVDGVVASQQDVKSKNLRTTQQFEELGEHSVAMEVKGAAGKSDLVQWTVTTHTLNSLPTIAEQSSIKRVSTDGSNELITFSVQNPEANDREIAAEIVAELPDGVSISSASGVSTGDAAIQTSSETVLPGRQNSMRLSIVVEDDSLAGETITIPYQIRYYAVDDEDVVYTKNERSLEVFVEGSSIEASTPGFGLPVALLSVFLCILTLKFRLGRSE